jgi:hypothetical protein
MHDDGSRLGQAYLQHLTDADLRLLGEPPGGSWRSRPDAVPGLLAHPASAEAVLVPGHPGDLQTASPFLVFAVAVHRTTDELSRATWVTEWLAPGQRAPIFDVAPLRDFLADGWRRLFLAELLASYTKVSSGSVVVATRRGLRRRRFSELDPVRLAELVDLVPEAERPGIYRRLGDLALFLTGVFPDATARHGLSAVEEGRLLRAGRLRGAPAAATVPGFGDARPVELLEALGRRWYRLAADLVPPPVPADLTGLARLAERFGDARRILNVVTDRYLFPFRAEWFGVAP